jgi:nitrogen-specific signal transduction histidine kinase
MPRDCVVRRSALILQKLRPAKATTLPAVKRSALQLVNHVQVLVHHNPPAVDFLEQSAARLRQLSNYSFYPYPSAEDIMIRSTDEDAREAARRLIDFIQVNTVKRPVLVQAVDHMTRALVVEEGRQWLATQLQQMNPEDVATMVALATQLIKNHAGPADDE